MYKEKIFWNKFFNFLIFQICPNFYIFFLQNVVLAEAAKKKKIP